MHLNARAAEIDWLRGKVAAGSTDVHRIHLPLIGLLAEDGQVAEAVAVALIAADCLWERGFPLQTFAVLNRAREVDPDHPELIARRMRRIREVDPGLLPIVAPEQSQRATVPDLRAALDAHHREWITRCTIRISEDRTALTVTFTASRCLPAAWVAGLQVAVAIAGHSEPIPCTVAVRDGQRFSYELALTPADDAAAATLRQLVRVDTLGTMSNIAALVITHDVLPPYHVRNVYCTDATASVDGSGASIADA